VPADKEPSRRVIDDAVVDDEADGVVVVTTDWVVVDGTS
jgi:hypothetical protein